MHKLPVNGILYGLGDYVTICKTVQNTCLPKIAAFMALVGELVRPISLPTPFKKKKKKLQIIIIII